MPMTAATLVLAFNYKQNPRNISTLMARLAPEFALWEAKKS